MEQKVDASNLKAELVRKGITYEMMAVHFGMEYTTINRWINHGNIRLKEALEIRDEYFPDCSIEYLFTNNE